MGIRDRKGDQDDVDEDADEEQHRRQAPVARFPHCGGKELPRNLHRHNRRRRLVYACARLCSGRRGKRRTVTLTARAKASLGIGGLPVLGAVPAGPLSENLSQAEAILDEQELLPHRPGDFLLIVDGDSMIGDGILHGDKVLIRPNTEPVNGEIAAVQVGNDYRATLKHVRFRPGRSKITLEASNSRYRPVVVPAGDVRIAGVYRGLIRDTSARL